MQSTSLSYERSVLYSTPEFEIVECQWYENSVSPMHDHGWSQCLVLVKQGTFENEMDYGTKFEVTRHGANEVISTPVGAQHALKCVSKEGGKTLHFYSPRIEKQPTSPSFQPRSLEQIRKDLPISLGESPESFAEVAKLLGEIEKHSLPSQSPFFMNQLFAGVLATTLVSAHAAARMRTTLATFEASPALTAVEIEVIDRLGELIGWKIRDGIGVAGGSAANFMALHCARQKLFPAVKQKGLEGQKCHVYVSSEAHYSFKKACVALGLGTDAVIKIRTDAHGRMDPQHLSEEIKKSRLSGANPTMIVATAGTTVLGAFDPITALAEVAASQNVWLHIDAAWGGPVLFSNRTRHLLEGVERADSFTFDAHKLLGSHLTTSFFLTRHSQILLEANDVSGGDYIFHSQEAVLDRGRLSWQCGRGADSLSFWTLWKNLGTKGIGEFVDRQMGLRDEIVKWIQTQDRLELVGEPAFLNVCVRIHPPSNTKVKAEQWSRYVREKLRSEDTAIVNFSTDEKGTFLRLILAHPRLRFEHLEKLLQAAQKVQ